MDVDEVKVAVENYANATAEAVKDVQSRIDKIEFRLNRPGFGGMDRTSAGALEKAWINYLRRGREGMDDLAEVKSLIVGDDTRGGYLAPPEFVAQVLKGIVQFSPIRQAATVGVTSAGSVILPKRTATPTAVWVGEEETRTETAPAYGHSKSRSASPLAMSTSRSACSRTRRSTSVPRWRPISPRNLVGSKARRSARAMRSRNRGA